MSYIMDKIIILFLFFDFLILIASSPLKSSPKEEQFESFLKMSLPLIKQNLINSQEFDSFYKLLANNEETPDRTEKKKTTQMSDAFESVKRKLGDDYGHLRFGRNEAQSQDSKWNSRIKYNDPDYGHMRFG